MKTPLKVVALFVVCLCTALSSFALTSNNNNNVSESGENNPISGLFLEYAKNGKTASMQRLVLAGIADLNINARGKSGYTALMSAILLKDVLMVRFLLSCSDLNLEVTDSLGRTAQDIAQAHAGKSNNDVSHQILQLFEDWENGVLEVVEIIEEDEEILNLVGSSEFDPNTWPPRFTNIFWGLGDC